MAPVTADRELTTRQSSRVQQQVGSSTDVTATTLRRSSRIRQYTKSASNVTTPPRAPSFRGRRSKISTRKSKPKQQQVPPPITPFDFLKLPPEIRNMIYANLLSAGQLSILRTCREVHMEAQSMIYREGVCRQYAGFSHMYYCPNSWLMVQNFELRCNVDFQRPPPTDIQTCRAIGAPVRYIRTWRPASRFGRGDIRRNQMVIELEFGELDLLSEDKESVMDLLDRPESFVGFRVLVVKFLNTPSDWSTAETDEIRLAVKDFLEPHLGTAVDYKGNWKDGQCMVFHPWSNAGCQNHTLEPVWFMNRNDGKGRVDTMEEEDEDNW